MGPDSATRIMGLPLTEMVTTTGEVGLVGRERELSLEHANCVY